MMDVLRELFTSKKAVATLAGVASWAIGRAGFDVPADDLVPIVGLLGTYILGQGMADFGKGKPSATEVMINPRGKK